jgi:aspartate/methionine/tyrosine aminotransferase
MQRAATVALDEGDDFLRFQVGRAHAGRDIVCRGLAATGRARFAEPDGAFYLFFGIDGEADTRSLALRLVDEAGIGVAPGFTFGDPGIGYMRLCFARDPAHIREATDRLVGWIARQ